MTDNWVKLYEEQYADGTWYVLIADANDKLLATVECPDEETVQEFMVDVLAGEIDPLNDELWRGNLRVRKGGADGS